MILLRSFRAEWLKRKRSFASVLVLGGSLFTPAIIIAVRLTHPASLPAIYAANGFWARLWRDSWESMAVFFLPLAAILATSLIAQIEFKSNAWKQVHTLPIHAAVTFFSKLSVILVMMMQFLLLFSAGIYASGTIPHLLVPGISAPPGRFFDLPLLKVNALYLLDLLPIIAAQYLMALRSSNFLAPIGAGFLGWVGAVAAISSRHAIWWPYSYTIIEYVRDKPKGAHLAAHPEFHWFAIVAFVILTAAAYVLFLTKEEKG